MSELLPCDIPGSWPVRPLHPFSQATDPVTCGACGLSWDDAIVTEMTPAPSARCPFESFHHDVPLRQAHHRTSQAKL
jgi:hypothetical protein